MDVESQCAVSAPDPLVESVRVLDREFKKWEQGQEDEFSRSLLSSIGVVCGIVTTGLPTNVELLGLFSACTKLAIVYQDILNEEGSGRQLVAAIEECLKYLDVVELDIAPPLRSVSSFLNEYGNAPQRFTWIAREFGAYDDETDKWVGPFFNQNGMPQAPLIEKEAATPGSVLGADYKPIAAVKKAENIRAQALKTLSQLQSGLFRPEGGAVPEKASVLDMLEDGQYPDVIARLKHCSLAEVLAVAREHGVVIKNREDDLTTAALAHMSNPIAEARGYVAPVPNAAPVEWDDDTPDYQPVDVDTSGDDDPMRIEDYVEPAKLTKEELEAFAMSFLAEDNEATAQDILIAAVEKTGKSASRQMLAPILKSLRG